MGGAKIKQVFFAGVNGDIKHPFWHIEKDKASIGKTFSGDIFAGAGADDFCVGNGQARLSIKDAPVECVRVGRHGNISQIQIAARRRCDILLLESVGVTPCLEKMIAACDIIKNEVAVEEA